MPQQQLENAVMCTLNIFEYYIEDIGVPKDTAFALLREESIKREQKIVKA